MTEPLDNCFSCGALVPDHQDYPYPGHESHCFIVNKWKKEYENRRDLQEVLDECDRICPGIVEAAKDNLEKKGV